MALSQKTKNLIWGQFAGRCAICKEKVIHKNNSGDQSLYGEVAHIIGEKNGSARFTNNLDLNYRNSEDNLLLLCANHHTIIDKEENECEYSTKKLHNIKNKYLYWIESNLCQNIKSKINLKHLFYLNIPRLNEVALNYGYKVDLQKYNKRKNLHEHGWDLNYIMIAYDNLFKNLEIDTLNFNKIDFIHEGYISNLIYFDKVKFRTKNINIIHEESLTDYKFTGELKNDPHIYFTHYNGWKLVLDINRNWITTTTAFGYFRPSGGTSTFSGFFRVTNVDYNKNIIFGSPFVIGLKPSPWDELLNKKTIKLENIKKSISFKDTINLDEALVRNELYNYDNKVCDFCKKILINDEYLIDGATKNGPWAWMCVDCFEENGTKIEYGSGQLYKKTDEKKWLLVKGYL